MEKYIKKPVTVHAIRYDGKNGAEIAKIHNSIRYNEAKGLSRLSIDTLEGEMLVRENDYVVRDYNGEYYPCRPDIFEKSYDKVK